MSKHSPKTPMPILQSFEDITMHTNDGAIGVFDSGVGGLSIAKCIATNLPNENIIYFADNLHAPYGDKSPEDIIERVNIVSDYLIEAGIKALVVACNTATVNAIDQLRTRLVDKTNAGFPIIGVEPAIKPATQLSKNKKVAVLATTATANNTRFIALVQRYKNDCDVIIQACPGLVELIEQQKIDSDECLQLLTQYLTPLIAQGIDTLVLGCTHYPFLVTHIKSIVGEAVAIVETASPVTEQLSRQLNHYQLNANNIAAGSYRFVCSEASAKAEQLISSLWQNPVKLSGL